MGFTCKIFGHKWNGCKCERCGETRDEQHDWNGCKCSRCGKTNATIYCVVTFSKNFLGVRDERDYYMFKGMDLVRKFDNLVKDNASYQSIEKSWLDADIKIKTLINLDVLMGPIRWLSSVTGDSIDTIQTLAEIRLFIAQGTFDDPFGGSRKIEYSVCNYFWRTETIEVPHNSTEPSKDNMNCPYYKDTKCIAGGQVNNCSANPHNYGNCYVYKYNSTGDYSVLYK